MCPFGFAKSFEIVSFPCSIFSAVWLFYCRSSGPSIGLPRHWMRGALWQIQWPVLSPDRTPAAAFVRRRCSRLWFVYLKDRVMAVRTPSGLVVRKPASECSQWFISKGGLSGDELRKPDPASLLLSWSSPPVLFLTRQSAASGKPLSVPFCLEKTSVHSRELMQMLPNDRPQGAKCCQVSAGRTGPGKMACPPKRHHLCHLALHLQSHKFSLNTFLCFQSSRLPRVSHWPENTIAILPVLFTDKAIPSQH